jgi:hypothetical protein
MTRTFTLPLLLAVSLTLRAADPVPTAEAILDRYVEVTGGKAAYAKRTSEVVTARVDFAAAGLSGKVVRYAQSPDKYYASMELPGVGPIEMGFAEGISWEKSAILGPRIKAGLERAEAVREATLNSTSEWRKLYPKVALAGTEVVNGEECYKVVMTPGEGNSLTMFLQKKSGLAVKMTTVASNNMGEIPVTILVNDYKNFAGVWSPVKTTQQAAGQEFTITVEKVEPNVAIPADRFALPAEIKALAGKK